MTPNDKTLNVYCDGGSRGNPGPAACAFSINSGIGLLYETGVFLGRATNNQAEYSGVAKSLEWFLAHPQFLVNIAKINYFLDSLLVVNQLKGLYKVKDFQLRDFTLKINAYISQLNNISLTFSHIPRSQNSRADYLVNQTLDSSSSRN